jgi:hypothetical protein
MEGEVPPGVTPVSLQLLTTMLEEGDPSVSFFAERSYPDNRAKEVGLIKLVYSSISGLIDLLPDVFETAENLDYDEFDKLDGTMASVEHAIEMFWKLLWIVDNTVVCIWDGIQALDSPNNRPHMRKLVDILRQRAEDSEVVIKLIVTSDDTCDCLRDKFNGDELVVL